MPCQSKADEATEPLTPMDLDGHPDSESVRSSPWAPGTTIADTYRIEDELGRGAMGVVLRATDLILERPVALKVIRPDALRPGFAKRFIDEAKAMATVNHPNVVTIYAFGVHETLPYFAMQLVKGETLSRWMAREPLFARTRRALSIVDAICRGVAALHEAGTIHRDIKPSNILLTHDEQAQVTDFGISARYRSGEPPQSRFAGTPAYMAPEIAFSDGRAGVVRKAADVYSVACVVYQLLTGKLPVEGANDFALLAQHAVADVIPPTSHRPDLPRQFDRVLLEGLAKNPRHRIQSVEELRLNLHDAWQRSLEPERILFAEDDPDFRETLGIKLRLEFPGTEIVCVENGREALSVAQQQVPSLALLDLQMPELDGMAVTKALRARPESAEVPIVILTAAGGPKEWQRLHQLGADRFLVKPVDMDDVVALIRRVLRADADQPD